MSRILLIGAGPRAIELGPASGPSIRCMQFYLPLRDAGHEIRMAALTEPSPFAIDRSSLPEAGDIVEFTSEAMTHGGPVRDMAESFKPDAVVGCGTILASATAARLAGLAPVWIDLFGDPIAELQSKAELYPEADNGVDLLHVWRLAQMCLRRGDAFSSVSKAQENAIVGALGMLGRLTRETAGRPCAWSIPCAIMPHEAVPEHPAPVFRGVQCPPDAFLVAWSGSYNTWIDPQLLFEGLTRAMARAPRLRFVSTGGGSPGYNEKIYEEFRAQAGKCEFAERFHFLGWLSRAEAEAVRRECDLGLNVDRWTYEGALGSRNRIVDFLDLGLPVASTILSEVSRELLVAGGVVPLPLHDAEGMAETLCDAMREPERLKESAARGQAFVREHYTVSRTTEPLVRWAEHPRRAGDWRAGGGYANHVRALTDFDIIESVLREKNSGRRRFWRGKK